MKTTGRVIKANLKKGTITLQLTSSFEIRSGEYTIERIEGDNYEKGTRPENPPPATMIRN